MKKTRTLGAGILLVALALGPAMPRAASAAPLVPPTVVATGTIDVCGGLADVIAFLESRPSSRLRDFLLASAQRLFDQHCAV
jgi:hypothetical protein